MLNLRIWAPWTRAAESRATRSTRHWIPRPRRRNVPDEQFWPAPVHASSTHSRSNVCAESTHVMTAVTNDLRRNVIPAGAARSAQPTPVAQTIRLTLSKLDRNVRMAGHLYVMTLKRLCTYVIQHRHGECLLWKCMRKWRFSGCTCDVLNVISTVLLSDVYTTGARL